MKILFTGDIYIESGELKLDEKLHNIFNDCDVRCGNLEGPIGNKKSKIVKIGPYLCQGKDTITSIKKNGFDLIALANNHIMDYGIEGLNCTINEIKKNNMVAIGAGNSFEDAYREQIFNVGNEKVAIINVAENGFGCLKENGDSGYAWIMHEMVFNKIAKLKSENIRVIIYTHCGLEDVIIPLPEWRMLFRRFIMAGADAVINSHPHVVQGWEEYHGGIIYYSLGNFAWFTSMKKEDSNSICAIIEFNNKNELLHREVLCKSLNGKMGIEIGDGTMLEKIKKYNQLLYNENEYKEEVNRIVNYFYPNIYLKYYYEMLGLSNNTEIIGWLKNIIKILLRRCKIKEPFLYHNIAIETHNMVVSRYLSLRLNEKINEQ